ncbi:MAG TPA: BlaI/MecI/CopY family transcriptional regulator [Rhizomicrobium sp.]|nr:BlaI/MecI/CopY family transcriptional regulator [Rhizomicrobium sp.]
MITVGETRAGLSFPVLLDGCQGQHYLDGAMGVPRLTGPELRIMEVLWARGPLSAREILEALPRKGRPAYATIQTVVYRLISKNALQIVKRVSKANVFEAVVSRSLVRNGVYDDLLEAFGDEVQPLMEHLIEARRITSKDIQEAERLIRNSRQDEKKGRRKAARVPAKRSADDPPADALWPAS